MNEPNWKLEMHRLLELFERESTVSLQKIKRYFGMSGRPFDENFRQYFLKLLTLRFDTSFSAVQFEHMDENPIGVPLNSTADNETASSTSMLNNSEVGVGDLNDVDNEISIEVKTEREDDVEAPIAVAKVSNNDGVEGQLMQVGDNANGGESESNAAPTIIYGDKECDIERSGIELGDESAVTFDVKREIKVENETPVELVDLPMVVFDPKQEGNEGYVMGGGNQSLSDQSQPTPSSSAQKQKKLIASKRFECRDCAFVTQYKCNWKKHQKVHDDSVIKQFKCGTCNFASRYKRSLELHRRIHDNFKPFKCEHCDYAARRISHLSRHQQIHDQQKSMGMSPDPSNRLHKCSHCDRQFPKWANLSLHLTKSHKNRQRLFNCVRCMRRFTREPEKNQHEMRCENRRYECHLCRDYVTTHIASMQRHMRTHSGAKPFPCAVCNRSFRMKSTLCRHMKSIHTAKSV